MAESTHMSHILGERYVSTRCGFTRNWANWKDTGRDESQKRTMHDIIDQQRKSEVGRIKFNSNQTNWNGRDDLMIKEITKTISYHNT